MAGIWNRIVRSGENDDCVSSHLIKASIYLVAGGTFTGAEALAAINSKLTTPLNAAAQADLSRMLTNIDALSGFANKLDYLERVDALNIAVENGVLTSESTYRTKAGLS